MSPDADADEPSDWAALVRRAVRLREVLDAVPDLAPSELAGPADPEADVPAPVVLHEADRLTLATLAGWGRFRGARLADVATDVTAVVRTDVLVLRHAAGTVEVPLEGLKVGPDLVRGRRYVVLRVPGDEPRVLMGGGPRRDRRSVSDLELLLVASATIWARARRDGTSTEAADSLWGIVHRQAVRVARPV